MAIAYLTKDSIPQRGKIYDYCILTAAWFLLLDITSTLLLTLSVVI